MLDSVTRLAILLLLLAVAAPAHAKTKPHPKPAPSASPATTSKQPKRPATDNEIDPEILPDEPDVWGAVLAKVFPDPARTTAIVNRTATDSNRGHADLWKALRYLRIEIPELDEKVTDDFEAKNVGPHALPALKAAGKIELVTWKAAALSMEEWHKFHAIHPEADNLAILSRVGISLDHNQALVYVEFACGDWCGGGNYYLLHPTGDPHGWEIDRTYQSWDFRELFNAPVPADAPK